MQEGVRQMGPYVCKREHLRYADGRDTPSDVIKQMFNRPAPLQALAMVPQAPELVQRQPVLNRGAQQADDLENHMFEA